MGFQSMADKCRGKLLPKSMRKTYADDARTLAELERSDPYAHETDYDYSLGRAGIGSSSSRAQVEHYHANRDRYEKQWAQEDRDARRREEQKQLEEDRALRDQHHRELKEIEDYTRRSYTEHGREPPSFKSGDALPAPRKKFLGLF